MKEIFWVVLLLVVATVVMAGISKTKGNSKKGTFGKRSLATANEQAMFWRLVEAFPTPEYLLFVQVSFGALLTAKAGASRFSFSQKRADFVLTNKGFKVLAVIELDDSSHKGNEAKDSDRDAMLQSAGYKVLRFASIPSVAELRKAMEPEPPKAPVKRAPAEE